MHVMRKHQRERAIHSSRTRDVPHAWGYRHATEGLVARHVSFTLASRRGKNRPARCTLKISVSAYLFDLCPISLSCLGAKICSARTFMNHKTSKPTEISF
jgi:hypothetical protein